MPTARLLAGGGLGLMGGSGINYFVDSVNGNDGYTGKSPAAAFATISALPAITPGMRINLAKGSTWREQLTIAANNVTVQAYGTGAAPILDASDIIANAAFTKTVGRTNVYQATVNVSAGWSSVWEDAVRFANVADLATCDATASSYTCVDAAGPMVLYIHASGDGNPITNGKTYETTATVRTCGITSFGYTGTVISGITCKRNRDNNGSIIMGDSTTLTDCTALEGTKHNIFIGNGSVLTGCIAQDAYFKPTEPSHSLYVYNANVGNGAGVTFTNCTARSTVYDGEATGFFGHVNVSGSFGTIRYNNCTCDKLFLAFSMAEDIDAVVIDSCTVTACGGGVTVDVPTTINNSNFSVTGAVVISIPTAGASVTVTDCTIACSNVAPQNIRITADGTSVTLLRVIFAGNGNLETVYFTGANNTLNAHYCSWSTTYYTSWYLNNITGLTVVSDYNTFKSARFWRYNGAYIDFAAWKAATSQDAHSTEV